MEVIIWFISASSAANQPHSIVLVQRISAKNAIEIQEDPKLVLILSVMDIVHSHLIRQTEPYNTSDTAEFVNLRSVNKYELFKKIYKNNN